MQTHVVNGTEKYIVNGNFINMHKKHLEKSIKLLKYNLEIQNKKEIHKKCDERDTSRSNPDFREPLDGVKRQKEFCDITQEHPAEQTESGRA